MNFKQFQTRIEFWSTLHFSAVISSQYGSDYEIYVTDQTSNAKGKLFITSAADEAEANQLIKQFSLWLIKINSDNRKKERDMDHEGEIDFSIK